MMPILLELEGYPIYSYPFFLGISWILAYKLIKKALLEKNHPLNGFKVLFFTGSIFVWIGAKLFFLIHSPLNDWRIIGKLSFWLGGGTVFYGGFLFAVIFLVVYCIFLKKFDFFKTHLFIPAICFSHAIGRFGCFLSGCCYGKYCKLPWAVSLNGISRHPVQLYEAVSVLVIGLATKKLIKINIRPLSVICFYFVGYATIRFILEFFRGDGIRGIYAMQLSAAQYFSIGLILATTVIVISCRKKYL
ncbi:MAG: prolipoprotein diacylglyceryl transferase [Halobacteriovoraceae bacterium]|nr:prolipoprotein diacylglyceryl transferase [Halobacteriovoraceae bacterium]